MNDLRFDFLESLSSFLNNVYSGAGQVNNAFSLHVWMLQYCLLICAALVEMSTFSQIIVSM